MLSLNAIFRIFYSDKSTIQGVNVLVSLKKTCCEMTLHFMFGHSRTKYIGPGQTLSLRLPMFLYRPLFLIFRTKIDET